MGMDEKGGGALHRLPLRGGERGVGAALRGRGTRLFVTPDGIDRQIRELSAVLARGISLALQPGLSYEDLEALLA